MGTVVQGAVLDELAKIAATTLLWSQFKDLFNSPSVKAKQDVKAHFKTEDPKKWDQFITNAATNPAFVQQLRASRKADKKTILHAINMGALPNAPVVGEIESQSSSGTKYQIKKMPNGKLGCTCGDWRYKGSVEPGYECKHIKAHKEGLNKVAGFSEMTSAFFDELQRIRDQQRREVFDGSRSDHVQTAKPYSELLTEGDTYYMNPKPPAGMEDPELIIGGSFVR